MLSVLAALLLIRYSAPEGKYTVYCDCYAISVSIGLLFQVSAPSIMCGLRRYRYGRVDVGWGEGVRG